MAKGLMLVLGGKPKGKPSGMMNDDDGDEAPDSEPGGAAEHSLAGEAFDALKDGDREGFQSAFVAAVRACADRADEGDYGDKE